ncbi:CIR protein [Plasmodium chabaudi chabaudi]|uniref:CIR protein n=1 Tax=Plasmodium chabaudi chabaudi TaxID=31271 RepID=A0A4V0K7S4_PLACU|nr:CIR protein [Plasmodium chabaudi chabaudi]VTZ68997.1 CIR protein [Plasmodium chabaudi chabaudi]|eukprot:XP_016653893.1 CIR protein [Plasmodium chabaudi chabaudi]
MDNLCEAIDQIDEKITLDTNGSKQLFHYNTGSYPYCINGEGGTQECFSYEVIVSSLFIKMVNHFMKGDDLKNNKLAEYAILWLCYKLNKKKENEISNLNDFHNKYIKGNENHIDKINGAGSYNSYKNIINNKKYLNTIDIKEMSKFYVPLKSLCKLYTEYSKKKKNYTTCSQDAQDFAKHFEDLNQDSSITENISYREILSSLSIDYDDFKNECAKNCSYCNDIPTLSEIKTPPSSSIASKLIPVLLTCSISFFLGIAYKYSLFGFDKRRQRQYLRENLKK